MPVLKEKRVRKYGQKLIQMHRLQCEATWIMKNQANMPLPKEINKALVTDPKEMESNKLPDKEFKVIVLRKLIEVQEDNKLRKNQFLKYQHLCYCSLKSFGDIIGSCKTIQ